MDEQRLREIENNRTIRGYIIRSLTKGHQSALLIKQITNSLIAENIIISPDIGKYLDYLKEGGYIAFTDKSVTAYTAYRRDAVIKLTKKGIDLIEGNIPPDPGVDV